ncbi:MAG: diaminopimelate epimerase [Verrucomicrobiota bacterium]
MELKFWKMDGAGNDFVVVDNRDLSLSLSQEQIATLCHRRFGIGADGFLAVEPAENGADYKMRYHNADGGEAEMCGNGARCFGRFVDTLTGGEGQTVRFETPAGVITADFVEGGLVRIGLTDPFDLHLSETLEVDGSPLEVHSINTGVPHACVVVPAVQEADVLGIGRALRYHKRFQPEGTNANLMEVLAPGSLAIRTYERGVEDETLACGTGMVANALIHHELTGQASPISVQVAGGDTLEVGFRKSEEGFRDLTLTGPARFVFEGHLSLVS